MIITVSTAPVTEAISLVDLKSHLKVDHKADDGYLLNLATTARRWVERYIRRALITQSITLEMDAADLVPPIFFPRPPYQALTSFTLYDSDGNGSAVASTKYRVVGTDPARMVYGLSDSWAESLKYRAATIIYTAGYGDSRSDIPEDIQQAIMVKAADLYSFRETKHIGTLAPSPYTAEELLAPYRYDYL